MAKEPILLPVGQVSRVYTPLNIAEQTNAFGFVFSRRVASEIKDKTLTDRAFFEGTKSFKHLAIAKKIESDSAGGATIGENSVKIWINAIDVNAGSNTRYIWIYFGNEKRLKLIGPGNKFPKGAIITWDLNQKSDWLEDNVKTDMWDDLALVTDSEDGIKIDRIVIRHSGQTILDWNYNGWLDGSKLEEYTKLVLTAKILETKLSQIQNLWVPQIHYAAREIGKTDGRKYGSSGKWCSEFASWCIRKALWDTPQGNFDSQRMENYFNSLGRKYTHADLINGNYQMVAGDYIRFQWSGGGQHSGIFIKYIDDAGNPSESTTIQTIEGNASSTVLVTTRKYHDILSVGNCQ